MRIKVKRKIKVRKKFGFFSGFLVAILLIASVFLFLIALDKHQNKESLSKQEIPQGVQEIVNECSNKSLIDAGTCVNNIVKGFWKYNDSNINKNMSFKEIQDVGGVCWHVSDLYAQIGEELGFFVETPVIKTG